MGVVVLRHPRPDRDRPEKGGARTAGPSMHRENPAAQGERGSQRCAKLQTLPEQQSENTPSLSIKPLLSDATREGRRVARAYWYNLVFKFAHVGRHKKRVETNIAAELIKTLLGLELFQ